MATFIPNGLLSLSTLSTQTQDTLEMPTFVSNGLLGGKLPQTHSEEETQSSPSITGMFMNNGLLGGPSTLPKSAVVDVDEPQTNRSSPSSWGVESQGITNSSSAQSDPFDFSLSFGTSTILPRLSVQARTHDGKNISIRKKTKHPLPSSTISSSRTDSGRTSYSTLLDTPIHRLMDGLSVDAARRFERSDQPNHTGAGPSQPTEDDLWVDTYRPQKFTELIGNERIARDAMGWLKQWDWCVFGKKRGKKRSRDDDEEVQLDEYHRPKEKVLLLSGPPGLGKTTLAHVIAQHAGYEVIEINASDARSGSIVEDRIRPTLESGYAIGGTKPVLLVLDEIDGATGAGENSNTFIHKLVSLVTTKSRKKKNRSGQKVDSARPILRPIVCICNDQNAASLAKLRPHAFHVRFTRPADIHLVKRLKEICLIEGMKADSRALSTLVNVARGDFRGCLNTLQLIKTRNEDVSEGVIRRATAGMKEVDSSVVSVLNNLFVPLSKKNVKDMGLNDEQESRYVTRLSREIDALGRDSAVASGCFGHYATRHRHDANLSRHTQGIEWLSTYDRFSSAMYSDGDFALHQYLPYTLVPFYPLFQERGGEKVTRNQEDWEHLQLTRANEEIYKSLSRGGRSPSLLRAGASQQLFGSPTLQLEFAPYINRIISPPLRPVNSQVVRPQEKALMTRLVDIMASLDLRFIQERSEEGTLSYRLDPPIDVFVTYDGKRASDIAVSRYAVRHLVAGEIDAKIITRDTEIVEKSKGATRRVGLFGQGAVNAEVNKTTTEDGPNKRVKTDIQDFSDKLPTDFFGRIITTPTVASTKAAARRNVEKKYRVMFRFLEGNSAAVRRPVKVNMFL